MIQQYVILLMVVLAAAPLTAAAPATIPTEARRKIEAALPAQAIVTPKQPRRLLVFDLNVVYGGHRSIPYANYAIQEMGKRTGAYEAVVSRDPRMFEAERLRSFDAVFLNNTVGNLFADEVLRENFRAFLYGGGGLLGYHGSSVAFQAWPGARETWPEFARILGARGCTHREPDEHVIMKNDDPGHPLNAVFDGRGFELRDEFFRYGDPYSRDRLRVLLSFDTERMNMNQGRGFGNLSRPDNDYAVSWVNRYGRGRIFYCSFGHNPYVFWNPTVLRYWLGAIQYALGDLPAGTTPSSKLTPARRARERLGWRLAVAAASLGAESFFEAIDRVAALGRRHIGADASLRVGPELRRPLAPGLSAGDLAAIRRKLYEADVRLVTYEADAMPAEEPAWRRLFDFGRALGIESIVAEPPAGSLDTIETLAQEYDITLAIRTRQVKASPPYRHPHMLLKACRERDPRIGAGPDIAHWLRTGVDPAASIEALGDRVHTVYLQDLDRQETGGRAVPWGTGIGRTEKLLAVIRRHVDHPVIFCLAYPSDRPDAAAARKRCLAVFDRASIASGRTAGRTLKERNDHAETP
jgi:type 1 glutamine amidotransferase/sugar phosphate isomerase/epimerase